MLPPRGRPRFDAHVELGLGSSALAGEVSPSSARRSRGINPLRTRMGRRALLGRSSRVASAAEQFSLSASEGWHSFQRGSIEVEQVCPKCEWKGVGPCLTEREQSSGFDKHRRHAHHFLRWNRILRSRGWAGPWRLVTSKVGSATEMMPTDAELGTSIASTRPSRWPGGSAAVCGDGISTWGASTPDFARCRFDSDLRRRDAEPLLPDKCDIRIRSPSRRRQ